MLKKLLFLLFFCAVFSCGAETILAQSIQLDNMIEVSPEQIGNICTLDPTDINAHYKFAPEQVQSKQTVSSVSSNFQISYVSDCNGNSWSQDAQAAFAYAASIWEDHLQSDIPIRIEANWVSLGEGTLGSAGPSTLFTLTGGDEIEEDTFYSISQASAITGIDIVSEYDDINFDIVVNINCEFSDWYFGTDANPPANMIDLVTVMVHEIGHGIGFTGSIAGNPASQTAQLGLGQNRLPIIYDLFALDGFFDEFTDSDIYSNASALYDGVAGRNDGVFFSGREAEFTVDGNRVPLYAPSTWQPGSSFSHVDQDFFENSENALMRPRIDRAFAIHSPGPVFCGMLDDMGWPLGNSCLNLIADDAPLNRPFLSAPLNGIKSQGFEPELIWNSVQGAAEYRLQLSDDFNFGSVITDIVISDTTVSVDNPLQSETLHFWRIKALDAQDESNWSAKWRFTTTITPPDVVVLSSPDNGFVNFRPGSQLRWQTADRAGSYTIQISTDPDFSAPIIDRIVSSPTFSATRSLDFSTTYYWRVKAENSGGESRWSDSWVFDTIIEKPEPVDIAAQNDPKTQVSVTPRLTWVPSPRASEYEIQISTSGDDFSDPVTEGTSMQPEFTVGSQLEFATIYFWRVKAVNIGGDSDWSEPESFTTQVLETEITSNYPNPFNSSTMLRYQLSDTRNVFVEMYDIGGRRVSTLINEEQQAGVYFYRINGSGFSSGVYFIRFIAGDVRDIQKMTLIK